MVWPPNIDFAFNLYCSSAHVLSFIMIIIIIFVLFSIIFGGDSDEALTVIAGVKYIQ